MLLELVSSPLSLAVVLSHVEQNVVGHFAVIFVDCRDHWSSIRVKDLAYEVCITVA